MSSSRSALVLRRLAVALTALLAAVLLLPAAARAQLLEIDSATEVAEIWPAVTLLEERGEPLGIAAAIAASPRFQPPPATRGSLGLGPVPVWLRVPVVARGTADWVLEINYPPLNRIDVWVLREGRVVQQATLGNRVPAAERPLRSRAHAMPLRLAPDQPHELFLRVQTEGARILPISIDRPDAFHERALREQMLQGVLAGLGLCLVVYSLLQWVGSREPMFWTYALLSTGSVMFSVAQFGIGEQYLWSGNAWAEAHAPGLAALAASAGTFLFVHAVLAEPGGSRWFSRTMHGGALALGLAALAFALDLISLQTVSTIVGTLGLAPALAGLPGALRRVRRGDHIGWYFIATWVGYFVTTAVMVSLIKGRLGVSPWTLHSFQIGATLDMLIFLRIIALRFRAIHEAARAASREHERLLSMAQTDALTGLPNRRGLDARLDAELSRCSPQRRLGCYLLDLDGFKAVNDEHGHETGDQLLVAVARRLRAALRDGDFVARLGGDEFVVVVSGLADDDEAHGIGRKLLATLAEPLRIGPHSCRLGMTIGYVIAPDDGLVPSMLLRRADVALYDGKRGGKGRLLRAEPVPVSAAAA